MHFAPIVPTKVLDRYLTGRKVWMALAQVEDEDYLTFYRNAPDDVTVILDNGAYERRLNVERLQEVISFVNPDVVVLPDIYLGHWERSAHFSLGLREVLHHSGEWMFVPQSIPGDYEGFMNALSCGLRCYDVKWIGLPRCLATDITGDSLARCTLAEQLRQSNPQVTLHALGMVDGNVHELYYLAERGVYSCDSSAPVWRTIRQQYYGRKDQRDIEFNFSGEWYNTGDRYLQEVDSACQGPISSTNSAVKSNIEGPTTAL